MSLPRGVVGWSVVCFSSSPGLWVGLWSMSLPHGVVDWSVVCVSFPQLLWVDLWSVSLPRRGCGLVCGLCLLGEIVGWSVSLPRVVCRLVCGLCLFLTGVVGWSVVWLFSSWGLWVGMLSVSLPRGVVDWSVVCVSFPQLLWVDLWSVSLPRRGCGLVCGLCLLGEIVGWSVSLPRVVCRLVCGLCLFLAVVVGWYVVWLSSSLGLWSMSLWGVGWSVPLPR